MTHAEFDAWWPTHAVQDRPEAVRRLQLEDLRGGCEAKVCQHPSDLGLRRAEAEIVRREPPLAAHAEPRLLGVELPGMHVEHGRLTLGLDAPEAPARPRVGEEPEVGPAERQRPAACVLQAG